MRGAENWQEWQFVIRTLLESDDLLEVCDGTLVKPEVGAENRVALLQTWTKADRAARKLMVTTVESKPLQLIMNCETAKDMWQKLHNVFDMKSEESLSLVQKKFFEITWDPAGNVAQHISALEQMASKMKALGGEIPTTMLITRILSTLPPSFGHFHSAWDSTDITKRTIENLSARLMTEELRMQKSKNMEESTVALFSKMNVKSVSWKKQPSNAGEKPHTDGKGRGSSFMDGRQNSKPCYRKRCYKCGSTDHIVKYCNKKETRKSNGESSDGSVHAFTGSTDQGGVGNHWLIDSGASEHMTSRREWFTAYRSFLEPLKIYVGNGEKVLAVGQGNIQIETRTDNQWSQGVMYDVLHTPGMKHNLFSVRAAAKKGIDFQISNNGKECVFIRKNKVIAVGIEAGKLYRIDLRVVTSNIACTANNVNNLQLWHERLGHQSKRHVKAFLKDRGIDVTEDNEFCDGCAFGKHHRLPFKTRTERAEQPREIIHTDVCGKMNLDSVGKSRYYVLFKDDYSAYRAVYFIKNKSDVKEKIKTFCNEIKTRFGSHVKELRSDGGGEYIDRDVRSFLNEAGIKHTVTIPYTPEQNGTAERENRIIVEAARSMLFSCPGLPRSLWAEAINCAVYVLNRTGPTKMEKKTPYELWFGKKTTIDNLKIFGTECFVHIPKEKRHKLDKKSYKGYLVGYTENVQGYRVWIPELHDVVLSRDVLFKNEHVVKSQTEIEAQYNHENKPEPEKCKNPSNESREIEHCQTEQDDESQSGMQLRDRRKIKQTEFYGNPVCLMANAEPGSYYEAINSENAESWKAAMLDEIKSLRDNNTYVLVDKPPNKRIIKNRWVYRHKKGLVSSEDRFKARLVVRGCSQREGIDYYETFSPVARFDTVRLIFSIGAQEKLHFRQFDIKTAFLYGTINEEIYMTQPEGFEDGTSRVCRLLKSLYGLKQAPRVWSEHFARFLTDCSLRESIADPCLYYRTEDGKKFLLVLWVDDGLIAASCDKDIDCFLSKLQSNFKATITTDVRIFLGIEIRQLHDGSIFLSQTNYMRKMLDQFRMCDAKPVSTPIDVGWYDKDTSEDKLQIPYREAVGHLMYLQVVTRPDIAFAVSVASRALESPTQAHWRLVKRIMRYIKGTENVGLHYKMTGTFECYSDADFAGDTLTRKSTTGVLCKFSDAAIIWQSKKQQSVALSTTEAEYVSASIAAKEIVWVSRLLNEIGIKSEANTLFVDNVSAIKLVKNPEFHQRTKHIDVRYHFVRDLYEKGIIDVKYVKSEDQYADILTKPLVKQKFELLRSALGLVDRNNI